MYKFFKESGFSARAVHCEDRLVCIINELKEIEQALSE